MSSFEDDQKLVQVVEHHQVLWDNRLKGFRDKKQTTHAWASVAEILEKDVNDVMARWGALRKQYSRKVCQLRQKGTLEDSPETNWQLFPFFSFLKPCITPRKQHNNLPQFNHIPLQPNYTPANNYYSTEELSSSMSDDGAENSPHFVHVNSAEGTRKSLRSHANKSKEQNKVFPSTSRISNTPINNTDPKDQTDNESVYSTVLRVTRRPGPKSAGFIPKSSQSAEVNCAVVKPTEMKAKKLKMSPENGCSSKINGVLEDCRSEDLNSKYGDFNQSEAKGCDFNQSEAKGCDCRSYDAKGFDADELFLLSLAPDLRRLSPRQKYEVKSKMLDIVSEQYLMN